MNGRGHAIAAWWGGFFIWSFAALAVYVSARDPVTRAHGKAALIFWTVAIVLYAPIAVWAILAAHYTALIVAASSQLLVGVVVCMIATVQAIRGLTLTGKTV